MDNNRISKEGVMRYLKNELKEYKQNIGKISADERKELHEWVADGNSVYSNPYYLYGENGHLMDYIEACRINEDMWKNPQNYKYGTGCESEMSDSEEPF